MRGFVQRFVAPVMVCLLMMGLLPFTVAAADDMRYGRFVLMEMDGSGRLADAYDLMVKGASDTSKLIAFPTDSKAVTVKELVTVFDAFQSDHPEFFWITNYSYQHDGKIVHKVTLGSSLSGSDLTNAKKAFDNRTKELIVGLSGKSDYEKAKILHDRLAAAVTYKSGPNDQNAYGALVEGKAMCAGYAHAYQHLMQQVGIPAWMVTGRSKNPATGNYEAHAWDAIKLDGEWYYTDVTWDDQGDDIFYAYFDLAKSQMAEDHEAGEFGEYLPSGDATQDNYFVKNDGVFSEMDVDRLAQKLENGNLTTRLFISGDKKKFETDLQKQEVMRQVLDKLGVPSTAKCSWSEKSLGHEIVLTVYVEGGLPTQTTKKTTTKSYETTWKTTGTSKTNAVKTTQSVAGITQGTVDSAGKTSAALSTSDSTAKVADATTGQTIITDENSSTVTMENTPVSDDDMPQKGGPLAGMLVRVLLAAVGVMIVGGGVTAFVVLLRRHK